MRLLIRVTTLLYPGAWRKRYGAELDALAEDAGSGWSDLVDILTGAFQMQIRSLNAWRFAALCGVVGVIVAGVYAWRVPVEFRSAVILQLPASQSRDDLEPAVTDLLSRDSLQSLIQKYNLYPEERQRLSPDEVARNMSKDIRVIFGSPQNQHNRPYKIDFLYPDPLKGMAVVQEL